QFISRSLTVYDCIIFSSCSIGIMTAVVSAIRVAAPNAWKAIVGRAMESRAVAELEVLSSTSNEVCEPWNGHGIVRVMGSPEVLELLYMDERKAKDDCGLFTLTGENNLPSTGQRGGGDEHDSTSPQPAPNIALNLGTPPSGRKPVLRLLAAFGVIVQLGVVVYSAMITYYPPWASMFTKDGEPVVRAAFPLMAVGTFIVSTSMFLCAAVVERSTNEAIWTVEAPNDPNTPGSGHPPQGDSFSLLWLQRMKTVNDQTFGSYAVFAGGPRTSV
ncbi:hypothetical protein B0T24DRAFT_534372, partial [Lasiosphaeria ovina]